MGLMMVVIVWFGLMGACVATPTQHIVGDAQGWAGKIDYKAWTSNKKFLPGDTLVFQYNAQFHSLLRVNQSDYNSCNLTSPQASYTSGKDRILLDKPGDYYFICGKPGHCLNGMKLTITVIGATGTPPATPSTATGQHYHDYV